MHHSPFAPLSGTERAPRGLFVHRWGTLLGPTGPTKRGHLRFEAQWVDGGNTDALFRAHQQGWRIYLFGNEAAVAEGHVTDLDWDRFEGDLLDHLRSRGVAVARNYACLDHPEGHGSHRRPSVFLLPDTGIFFHAAQVDGIDLGSTWVVGDSTPALVAAERAGCRSIALETGLGCDDGEYAIDPDLTAADLVEALRFLTVSAAA